MEKFNKEDNLGEELNNAEVFGKQDVIEQSSYKPEATEIPNEDEIESVINVKSELGKSLNDFYSVIKNKFSDQDAGWTPSKLATASTEKLGPIIQDLRGVLKNGGSAEPDVLIQVLINEAQDYASKGKGKHEFIEKITRQENIVPGSELYKFLSFAAKGLE